MCSAASFVSESATPSARRRSRPLRVWLSVTPSPRRRSRPLRVWLCDPVCPSSAPSSEPQSLYLHQSAAICFLTVCVHALPGQRRCWLSHSVVSLWPRDPQRVGTLCDPVDHSPPGSSVHGIFQARMLEWVAMPSSRGSSPPRDETRVSCVSCIGRRFFTHRTQKLGERVSNNGIAWRLSGKEPTCNGGDTGDAGSIPGLGRSPRGGSGYHSSILTWRVPWTEEAGGPQSMGSQRVRQDWAGHTRVTERDQA